VEFLNPQILEVGGTKKKKLLHIPFEGKKRCCDRQRKRKTNTNICCSLLRVWLFEFSYSARHSCEFMNEKFPNSKYVEVFSWFIYAPGPKPCVCFI